MPQMIEHVRRRWRDGRSASGGGLQRLALAFGMAAVATAAHADPCEAALPSAGATFQGPVSHIIDGDGLCVAALRGRERDPASWVEVRVADFFAPELSEPAGEQAKRVMSSIAAGRWVVCSASARSYDRVVAVCRLKGTSLGELMRRAGVREGGRGLRRRQ